MTTTPAATTLSPNTDAEVIAAALAEFVTILLDGAFDTEGEHAHLDVIALCYVMPVSVTDDWPAWDMMAAEWFDDGRAPRGVKVTAGEVRFAHGEPGTRIAYHYSPYAHRWWNSTAVAAEHVAKVIADGLDDELLIFVYGPECEVKDCERMDIARRLAAIAGPEQGNRILDHLERVLDELDAADDPAFVPSDQAEASAASR